MDYCRQEGTYRELKACLKDVENHINGVADDPIDSCEILAFTDMVKMFCRFLGDHWLLDEEGNLDGERLDQVCKSMTVGCYCEDDDFEEGVG